MSHIVQFQFVYSQPIRIEAVKEIRTLSSFCGELSRLGNDRYMFQNT